MTKDAAQTNEDPAELLQRAYSLKGSSESKALYAEWAKTYDKTMLEGLGYLTPEMTAKLLAAHVADKWARILDVGAGTGLAGKALASLGYANVDGLDYSPQMLAVAESRNVYSRLFEADLNQPLAVHDAEYEAIICTGTFTHAHVGAACLDELFRILKPGAKFACTIHKDVWQSGGFAAKIAGMENAGILDVVHCETGHFYAKSEAPEGWYCVWRKTGNS